MLFIRVLFSTGLVLGLIWYIARSMRQPKGLLSKIRQPFAGSLVENRTAINRTTTVAVIRFGDQRLLVAANDNAISLLGATDVDETAVAVEPRRRVEAALDTDSPEIAVVEQMLQRPSIIESLRGMTVRTPAGPK
jgi:hypothetical protein